MKIHWTLTALLTIALTGMIGCPEADLCADVSCEHGSCAADTGSCVCDDNFSGELCEIDDSLEIIGSYTDNYTSDHEVSQTTWVTMGSTFHISQYSNADDYLVAENDASNAYNPSQWSRFDWTTDGAGDLFYCQIVYDAADEDTALAASDADRGDLSSGCNSFAWSQLTGN